MMITTGHCRSEKQGLCSTAKRRSFCRTFWRIIFDHLIAVAFQPMFLGSIWGERRPG